MVITGGYDPETGTQARVTQFWQDGSNKNLPELNFARFYHGCSSYVDSDNNIVSRVLKVYKIVIKLYQVLLVTAGYNDGYVRSTELLVTGTSSWTLAADYPLPVTGLSGASINNTVLMTGGET